MGAVAVTGPRQSGKTTLCRAAFPSKPFVSLELLDERAHAEGDARGFLKRFPQGAVLDEVQRTPKLFSELQVDLDARHRPGRWILTGSQHFGLLESISQSLAGRISLLNLLPLSLEELANQRPATPFDAAFVGGYPRLHDLHLHPREWLADYLATYVERDVRQVLAVGDLATFQTFLRLCAGRAGQLVNLSSLGADAGISHHTARSWLSVLETSFVVFRLQPYFKNLGKRLVKSPKLYFHDTGLLCHLLGLRSADELRHHHARGAVFENLMVTEILKSRLHRGLTPDLYFYRDQRGTEIDLVLDHPLEPVLIEIKSGETFVPESVGALDAVGEVLSAREGAPRAVHKFVVYAGEDERSVGDVVVLPWPAIGSRFVA